MKATGIVRRIDELGRVVIPKEIRRTLRIKEGDKVIVRLDALPEVPFEGYISHIGLFCYAKDYSKPRQKSFDVEVRLLVSDERLKPGMTVSCEFLEDE